MVAAPALERRALEVALPTAFAEPLTGMFADAWGMKPAERIPAVREARRTL